MPACNKKEKLPPDIPMQDTVFTATYITDQLPVADLYYLMDTAWLRDGDLKEISGLVCSSATDNATYWGEEDSGNKNAIYLLDTSGRNLGAKYLQGILDRDWEDIAAGPGPETGKYYLYMGDIGDNLQIFPYITIYRFMEPAPDPAGWTDSLIHAIDAINLVYPDGPHDAEALMIDPQTRDLYILTKGQQAMLYMAKYPQNTHQETRLIKVGVLPISTVTAADISPDGYRILIKNYESVFFWKRQEGESIAHCLQGTPQKLPYHQEPQGESIAWSRSGKGFYTISEEAGNIKPVLFHYVSY
jgi:hypothetical protein